MSKRLDDLFELDTDLISASENDLVTPLPDMPEIPQEAISVIDRINNALPQVRGLEASDSELDDLAQLARDQFQALNDLGMQVDSRFASEIFAVSSTLLGHAITAKTAKVNKKLKLIDLQLKQAALIQKQQALEAKLAEKEVESKTLPSGEGRALDRNELLRTLMGSDKNT